MPGELLLDVGFVVFIAGAIFSVMFAFVSIFDEKNSPIVIKFQRLFTSTTLIGIGLIVLGATRTIIHLILLN